ncbi:MAG: transglutaminase-like cysteine peptidase [Campylobacterota bacterium]|nr:transglutaminase-like cysteine peptidase [Campylobacterota bacterium]
MNFFSTLVIFLLLVTSSYAKDLYSIDKMTLEFAEINYGVEAKNRMLELVKLLNSIDKESENKKLKYINDFFNKIEYNNDLVIYKQKDYWATREEFLNISLGDCEDYVIAKYFSLRQLGLSDEKLFLTYVKAIKYKQSHMVLTYFKKPTAVPLVLDNINPTILPSTSRKDLRPLFSFNGEKIYMAKQRGLGREVPKGKINLKKWTNLILKIKKGTP